MSILKRWLKIGLIVLLIFLAMSGIGIIIPNPGRINDIFVPNKEQVDQDESEESDVKIP